jgi:hypothetical protein
MHWPSHTMDAEQKRFLDIIIMVPGFYTGAGFDSGLEDIMLATINQGTRLTASFSSL